MRGKKIHRLLSILLVVVLLLSVLPGAVFAKGGKNGNSSSNTTTTEAATAALLDEDSGVAPTASDTGTFYKIVHVDCGRKYFSPENIKKIIDNAAAAGFNQVELYLSDNQGFRFALDDMNVTTSTGNTYDLTPALGDGYSDGSKYPDGSGKYLTQSEMTDIISYAAGKEIDIVPCVNVPGHMGAILEEFTQFKYSGSNSSIDLENAEAVAFALAITEKYATYFESQGVKYYNLGADEYANDLSTMGFQGLYTSGKYQKFVDFLNNAAQIVINHNMTPRAFNDGIYYNEDNTYSITNAIEVCYWSCGWSGYNLASAQYIVNQGMNVINTHGDYYWVLGNTSWQCSADKASQFDYTSFQYRTGTTGNGTISNPAGAMFCIWCDYGNTDGKDDGAAVVSATAGVIAAFGAALPASETDPEPTPDPEPGEPVEVTENKTITVTVGQTATDTIEGADYSNNIVETELDKSIATVSAEYEQVTGGTEEVKATSITSGSSYYIKNSSGQYLSSSATWVSDISSAALWTATSSIISGYTLMNGNNYLRYQNSLLSTTPKSRNATTWTFSNGTFSYTQYSWGGSTTYTLGNAYTVTTTAPVNATTVTFTGVTVGTTYVTVGNTRYTINVVAEDLSKVTPLTVEFWITNRQVTANGATSMTIAASASGVYSESGALFSSLVPAEGTAEGNTMVFWKGTRLASNNKQTTGAGVDKTTSGTDFTYIRYWNGSWAYSADGKNWTNVASGDQIVAYYLQKTEVTDEVTTQVVDWGPQKSSWGDLSYLGTSYVLLDFAVVYESGEKVPASFPVANSLAFHCDTSSTNLNKVTFQDGSYYYRHIGLIKAEETADYEVYMITLTPSSDNKGTVLASTASGNTSYSYSGTEKVIWVDDEANLGDFANAHYTDPVTGADLLTVGGEATVPELKIYKQQGMLVTYYVRAKVTEDSLAVHYIDQTVNQEFYSYNIAVKFGTLFNENIGLADPWKGNLTNGSVTNNLGKTQTVSADLGTMPAIGAQYRYSDYTCVKVERSENGKDLYLYYTFNNAHSFVIDFGLPLNITTSDLGISGDWTSASVSGAKFGTATATVGEGVTYTPNRVLTGVETLQLTLSDATGSVTHQIYIYPASNVLYEDTFLTVSNSSVTNLTEWKHSGNTSSLQQSSENKLYGYDAQYATSKGNSMDSCWTVSGLTSGNGTKFLTTSFYGNGFDLIGTAGQETGIVYLVIQGIDNKLIVIDTSYSGGTLYQVPLAHEMLTEGNYTVYVRATYRAGSGTTSDEGATASVSTFSTRSVMSVSSSAVNDVYSMIDELFMEGFEIDDVEFVYFDESSSLAELDNATSAVSTFSIDTGASTDGVSDGETDSITETDVPRPDGTTVTVDGFRVYINPTDEKMTSAYHEAGEDVFTYTNILDAVLTNNNNGTFSDMAYVEGGATGYVQANYEASGGPQNELYLKPSAAVVIQLENEQATAQISARAVTESVEMVILANDTPSSSVTKTIATNTEMYYAAPVNSTVLVVVNNSATNMLALGNLKVLNGNATTATEATIQTANLMLMSFFSLSSEESAADPVFTPEKLDVKVKSSAVLRNKLVSITVNASTDVAKLTVNGKELKPTNSLMVKWGLSKTYTYVFTDVISKSADKSYEIIAYNADGLASAPVLVEG